MTKRAVIIGLVVAASVGALGFFNDMVMKQTFLFSSYMPVFVYGSLLLFIITLNPLLRRLKGSLAFTGKELALIVALVLPAAYVGGRGFIHHFSHALMTPRFHNRTMPGWQRRELLRRLPSIMLAGVQPEYLEKDIPDPAKLAAALNTDDSSRPLVAKLKGALPGPVPETSTELQIALNLLLKKQNLFTEEDFTNITLPAWARHVQESGPRTDEEWRRLNRHRIDTILGDLVVSLEWREEEAITGHRVGIRQVASEPISLSDIPWHAWFRTLTKFWLPLVFTIAAAYIGLALVFKRQWAEHEHLPFPIVNFAKTLLPEEDRSWSSVFRQPMFWIAVGFVAFVHLNNYACNWWPNHLIRVPVQFNFGALRRVLTTLNRGGGGMLFYPTFFFTVIGFAYFIAADVAFSVGAAPFIYCTVAGIFATYGVSLHCGDPDTVRISNSFKAGAYVSMFVIIIYVARHFCMAVLRRAVGLKAEQEIRRHEIWGARVALFATALFAIQLSVVGLNWYWAVLHTLIICMAFIVVSKMVGETGMFLFHPMILPGVVLMGVLGPRAIGGEQLLIIMVVSLMMEMPCQVGLMPMMVHSLKLSEGHPGRTAALAGAGVVLTILIGVTASIYFQYDRGAAAVTDPPRDGWSDRRVSKAAFNQVVKAEDELDARGVLENDNANFFTKVSPKRPEIIAFVLGIALVLIFEFCRLRMPKWPLHPIIFLLCGFWNASILAGSFLLGWLIRVIITKYGGAGTYNRLKPLMIGLIAGDMLAGILITIIGFIYYFITGEAPKQYSVFPG